MRLQARFIQLPLKYDAERLAKEVTKFGEECWLPHPQRFEGNDFLPLISINGEPENESFTGQMAPTKYLEECPYLIDVLASFGASLGRTRLMRLSGGAEVTPHVDIHYYWRDRMRIHVPIVTQPTVSFHCGGLTVNMAAGECWIFDTFARHRVINDAERKRIHLVADTVGGEGFYNLAAQGRLPEREAPGWAPRMFEPLGATVDQLEYESQNMPVVMTPWEIQNHVDFLFREAAQQHPQFPHVAMTTSHFTHVWRALWSTYGESKAGWPRYRKALDDFTAQIRAARANEVKLRNGSDLHATLMALVVTPALGDRRDDTTGETRADVAAPPVSAPNINTGAADPRFDRPIFIVNPPRSGSSLLFETLAQAPDLYTVGGESHQIVEGIRGLGIVAANFDSNCLDESHARPEIVSMLRERFEQQLRNRDNAPPGAGRVRMLEKTPKNALRIPFLAKAFPEAHFIYLYRDPRQVLSSMMEGWESGRFVMYPNLPGWTGPRPWSFLLTPGWRELNDAPLERLVAGQWSSAMKVLLDSLDQLPTDRWSTARYDALIADPNAEIARICKNVGLDWDRTLGQELPIARHTVSKPNADKWRGRGEEIESVLPSIAAMLDRAANAAQR
ncbi:MAG: sulfotransferase [Hyphomonadaceae bacterium]